MCSFHRAAMLEDGSLEDHVPASKENSWCAPPRRCITSRYSPGWARVTSSFPGSLAQAPSIHSLLWIHSVVFCNKQQWKPRKLSLVLVWWTKSGSFFLHCCTTYDWYRYLLTVLKWEDSLVANTRQWPAPFLSYDRSPFQLLRIVFQKEHWPFTDSTVAVNITWAQLEWNSSDCSEGIGTQKNRPYIITAVLFCFSVSVLQAINLSLIQRNTFLLS